MKGRKIRRIRKKRIVYDLKLTKNCKDCNIELPKNSVHHFRCKKCWEEHQIKRGNTALIAGIGKLYYGTKTKKER